jgi:hypothetical protein
MQNERYSYRFNRKKIYGVDNQFFSVKKPIRELQMKPILMKLNKVGSSINQLINLVEGNKQQ